MGMFDFKCTSGHVFEEVFLPKDGPAPATIDCPWCNAPAKRQVPLIASTPTRWGDSHGHYSPSLGYVKNGQHKDRLLKEKGLIPESDLPSGYVEARLTAEVDAAKQHEADVSSYNENLKTNGGDKGRALADTFNTHRLGLE